MIHRFLTGGESHGPGLTTIVEGFPAGLALDVEAINHELTRRQGGYGRSGRQHIERDEVQFWGGVENGVTTGGPIVMQIANRDYANFIKKEHPRLTAPRPGHADLVGAIKYGYSDMRTALERSSARETAARTATGALAKQLLGQFGVKVGSVVTEIGGEQADVDLSSPESLLEATEASPVRCPDTEATERMKARIDYARRTGDTLGGVFVVWATGLPIGLGSYVHWDRRLDGLLAWAVMSIQAIKGVEIGEGFENARMNGRDVHDQIYVGERGLERHTNRAGGLEGGVTNGQPLIVRAAMKPISTTINPLQTVDVATGEAASTQYQRSDFCAVPAAGVVGEAMVAWILADVLHEKLGGDSLSEMRARTTDDGRPTTGSAR
ncbi:MAG TPA: chorismate synthase [Chloroflexia bacterium]|nr:chorismate synthase [Chloroflexia bacterium]